MTNKPDRYFLSLCLATLGVVYGDIGTSPLYTMRQCFFSGTGVAVHPANVLGVLSLIFWSLTIVISLKYILYVMRADNRGEGGILALMALSMERGLRSRQWRLSSASPQKTSKTDSRESSSTTVSWKILT